MIYQVKPIARTALWGGKTVRRFFGFAEDFGDDVGQAWVFSAQPQGMSILQSECEELTLGELWETHPALFKSRYERFPFIVSLIAPEQDLSIQVHPNDEQAREMGYAGGKNEGWIFLRAPEEGSIVYGHRASDRAELLAYIERGDWQGLICRLPVAEGEAVMTPAGVLHALAKGCVAYEVQQANDITYRLYDYGRRDAEGKERPLQLERGIQCLSYGDDSLAAKPTPSVKEGEGFSEALCLQNEYFTVRRITCNAHCSLRYPYYLLATVVSGEGTLNGRRVTVGMSFLIPANEEITARGMFTILATSEE